jgi:hypothetical protein
MYLSIRQQIDRSVNQISRLLLISKYEERYNHYVVDGGG